MIRHVLLEENAGPGYKENLNWCRNETKPNYFQAWSPVTKRVLIRQQSFWFQSTAFADLQKAADQHAMFDAHAHLAVLRKQNDNVNLSGKRRRQSAGSCPYDSVAMQQREKRENPNVLSGKAITNHTLCLSMTFQTKLDYRLIPQTDLFIES